MILTVDTNVLVRAAMMEDPVQSPRAALLLHESEGIVVPLVALCEFVWVLRSGYRRSPDAIAASITSLLASSDVVTDRAAVDAGLAAMKAGGDFADGVICHTGAKAGGEVFASFDRVALKLAAAGGQRTLDLNGGPPPLA